MSNSWSSVQIKVTRRHIFIAVTLLGVAGVIEGATRWLFPVPEVRNFNRTNFSPGRQFSTEAKQRLLQNVLVTMESEPDGFRETMTLNIYGFRGPTFSLQKSNSVDRVVFIGDSFAEGMGVGDDQTIPVRFADLLPPEHQVEVINLGVAGARFEEYDRLANEAVPLLSPDHVFLVLFANDVPASPLAEGLPDEKPDFEYENTFMPRIIRVLRSVVQGRPVPKVFPAGPFPFFAAVPDKSNPLTKFPNRPAFVDPEIFDAMKRGKCNPALVGLIERTRKTLRSPHAARHCFVEEHLRFMKRLCGRHGCSLTVVYIPCSFAVSPRYLKAHLRLSRYEGSIDWSGPEYRKQQDHLRSVTQRLGIPLIDMTGRITKAESDGARLYWLVDTHLRPEGTKLVGEMLAEYWLRRCDSG